MADQILDMIHQFDPQLEFKYNKFYIGLAKNDQPNNFVTLRPKKNNLRLEVRLPQTDELDTKLENSNLDAMDYRWGKYRIRLSKSDLQKQTQFITELLHQAFEAANA
jgi:predicted transport protein